MSTHDHAAASHGGPKAAEEAAVRAVEQHHGALARELGERVEAMLATAAVGGEGFEGARRRTADFLGTELAPHARAEEESLYPAAARSGEARLLIDGMLAEHRVIFGLADEVAQATDPVRAAAAAYALQVMFQAHLAKENDLVLPVVVADHETSLAEVLHGMHELLGHADAKA
jgi:iron-sulfur cluster repair protein YtfE (RIC family)